MSTMRFDGEDDEDDIDDDDVDADDGDDDEQKLFFDVNNDIC